MPKSEAPLVTVCIPATMQSAHLDRAVESVLAQTDKRVRIRVSFDATGDGDAALSPRHAGLPNVESVRQPSRLGWAGNINALLDLVDTKYFLILFHDDALAPRCIETLLALLEETPKAVCAFGDMDRRKGAVREKLQIMSSVVGGPFERLRAAYRVRNPSTPLRGLARSSLLKDGLRTIATPHESLGADFAWTPSVARFGGLVRVPEPLYVKHVNSEGVSAGWWRWPAEKLVAAFAAFGACMLADLARADVTPAERTELTAACLAWVWDLASERLRNSARATDMGLEKVRFDAAMACELAGVPAAPEALGRIRARADLIGASDGDLAARVQKLRDAKAWSEMEAEAAAAISVRPSWAAMHVQRSIALRNLGDFEAARDEAAEAVELAPDDPDARVQRGYALAEMGDWEAARAEFHAALRIDDRHAEAHFQMSRLLAGLDQTAGATGHARSAVALRPDRTHYRVWLDHLERAPPAA